jgi:hypothetical protein
MGKKTGKRTGMAGRLTMILVSALLAMLCVAWPVGTLSWQDNTQHKSNEMSGILGPFSVILQKYGRGINGQDSTTPLPNARFSLYRVASGEAGAQDERINDVFISDEYGQIVLCLTKPGQYYFLELDPPYGYTFDLSSDGHLVTRYDFTVTEGQKYGDALFVKAYNRRACGLIITKTVRNANNAPLSDAQKNQSFDFTVTFSGNGTYPYVIREPGPTSGALPVPQFAPANTVDPTADSASFTQDAPDEPVATTNPTTGTVFVPDVPTQPADSPEPSTDSNAPELTAESAYSVDALGGQADMHEPSAGQADAPEPSPGTPDTPTDTTEPSSSQLDDTTDPSTDTTEPSSQASDMPEPFTDTTGPTSDSGETPEPSPMLADSMELASGQMLTSSVTLSLRHGQQAEFYSIPENVYYTVTETPVVGYSVSGSGHEGDITANGARADFVNTFGESEPNVIEIAGEKTWDMTHAPIGTRLPDSIIVQLMDGETIVDYAIVTPGLDGRWRYLFHAPKYREDGLTDIHYTVSEQLPNGYANVVSGYDILNIYVPPDPPVETVPPHETPPVVDVPPTLSPWSPPSPVTEGIPSQPNTGDESNVTLWVILALMALGGIVQLWRLRGEEKQ